MPNPELPQPGGPRRVEHVNSDEDGLDDTDTSDVVLADDPSRTAFLISVAGHEVGRAEYRDRSNGVRVFTHTEIDPDVGRRGLGSMLVRFALEEARDEGRRIVPRCPFVAEFLQRHPEYADLVVSPPE